MALIKCPQCGKPVSDRAKKCPHCGFVNSAAMDTEPYEALQTDEYYADYDYSHESTGGSRKRWIWVLVIAAVLLAGGIAALLVSNHNKQMQAQEQARQDSIAAVEEAEAARLAAEAAREQARQDSIAAEKARQDSIARWDFYTAKEITDFFSKRFTSLSTFRSFCQRHGLKLLYDKEYKEDSGFGGPDPFFTLHALVGAKGCELISGTNELGSPRPSLKPTSDVAFGVVLTLFWDYYYATYFASSHFGPVGFAFPTKEARDKVYNRLRPNSQYEDVPQWKTKEEKNGLYWIYFHETE